MAVMKNTQEFLSERTTLGSRTCRWENNTKIYPKELVYGSIDWINPLKPELNPICYLLALLAHHFLHVSRIRVKSLTLR